VRRCWRPGKNGNIRCHHPNACASSSAGNGPCASSGVRCLQCNEHPSAGALERGEDLRRLDGLQEQRIERRCWGAVQHQPDIIVAGNGGDAEKSLAVRAPRPPARLRWCARKDGLPMKKSEKADRPMSRRRWPAAPCAGREDRHRPRSTRRCVPQAHPHLPRIDVCRAPQPRCRPNGTVRRRKPYGATLETHPQCDPGGARNATHSH
jgi:hypothetical protein